MIKMQYQAVMNFEFVQAVQKLANTALPQKDAYNIKRLVDKLTIARKAISEEFTTTVMEKFAQKNEQGEFVRPEGDKTGYVPDPAKLEEFAKAQEEFGKKEGTIDREKLHISAISSIQLSARELSMLDPVLTEGEESPNVCADEHKVVSIK